MPSLVNAPKSFHDRFAAFVRIESRCRTDNLNEGVKARTADALWMLARQWQFGEFQGEDAGSPIKFSIDCSRQAVDTYTARDTATAYDVATSPLEVEIEQERPVLSWKKRVAIGQDWERRIRAAVPGRATEVIEFYRTVYPLTVPAGDEWDALDFATRRFLTFMSGRVVDGKKLLSAIPFVEFSGGDATILEVIDDLHNQLSDRYIDLKRNASKFEESSWRSETLDYRFKLNEQICNAAGQPTSERKTELIASNYRNGDLDWHSVAVDGDVCGAWEAMASIYRTPTRLSIGGTSLRWWAFESAETDFGDLDVSKPDLAKLVLMEFTLIYGDDWYSVPIPIPMSSLVKIDKLKVHNTFGDQMGVLPARKVDGEQRARWDIYSLCKHGNRDIVTAEPILFIPPVAGFREESRPLEDVHFLRDEGANMVWAVEKKVLDGMAQPIDGFDAQRERIQRRNEVEIRRLKIEIETIRYRLENEALTDETYNNLEGEVRRMLEQIERLGRGPFAQEPPVNNAGLKYRFATKVPENWFPFTPVNTIRFFDPSIAGAADEQPPVYRLRRAQMLRNTDDQEPTAITAFSRLLKDTSDPILWIDENSIGRSGLRVQLTQQRLRWMGGKTFTWLGRKVLMGRGEGSSGLRFDVIDEKKE